MIAWFGRNISSEMNPLIRSISFPFVPVHVRSRPILRNPPERLDTDPFVFCARSIQRASSYSNWRNERNEVEWLASLSLRKASSDLRLCFCCQTRRSVIVLRFHSVPWIDPRTIPQGHLWARCPQHHFVNERLNGESILIDDFFFFFFFEEGSLRSDGFFVIKYWLKLK